MSLDEEIGALIDQRVAAAVTAAIANLPARAEPALVSTSQLCEQLSISKATLHRLRARGLPCVMLADAPRFSVAKVIAWLESR